MLNVLTGKQQELQKAARKAAQDIKDEQEKLQRIIAAAEQTQSRLTQHLPDRSDKSLQTLPKAKQSAFIAASVAKNVGREQLEGVSNGGGVMTEKQRGLRDAFTQATGRITAELSNINASMAYYREIPTAERSAKQEKELLGLYDQYSTVQNVAEVLGERVRKGGILKPPAPRQ